MGGDITSAIAAGLPNINASAQWEYMGYSLHGSFSGALCVDKVTPPTHGTTQGSYAYNYASPIVFDASLSNSIYGNSDTVMPPTIQLIPQIKF